jgi:signal transduction histidine kinase/CheY-like chemotaxis protein
MSTTEQTERGAEINLEDLRSQLAGRLAVALMVASLALLWVNWPQESFPFFGAIPLAALIGIGWGVRKLVNVRPALARHLLVWSLTAGLLAAMWLFSDPWLPFLGLPLTFVSALLVSGGQFATAGATAALAAWLARSGARPYPLLQLLVTQALAVALAWEAVRTLYTALGWAWTMQQRADHLLELSRDRQGELSNALKSVDLANTVLRRTQRELISARRQAEEARLMKEQFAANISHELRTPLNLILGFSEVMYLSPEIYGDLRWPATLRQDVYQIYRSSRHLLEMIDDVLDLSRFEIAGFTLNREPTPLEPLLHDAAELAQDLFRGRPVHLELEIGPDLPPPEIDRTRVRQVLLNLLNNAARFTEEGVVRVEARRADGEIVISVSDTGPGISVDELSHIFEEFYQVDRSLRRRHGGAGLGLAISKHFVEAHDGRIWAESQEGAGSTFYFALPIPGQYVPLSRLRVDRPLEPQESEVRPPILVIDPDPAVADLVRRHIEEYEVMQVEDVDRLADEVTLHHPQAVVWNVPPGNRANRAEIPALPAPCIECSLPSQAWLAGDLEVSACLTKPITAAQLLQQIKQLGHVQDVLVVDDDRGFCQLVERMLGTTGQPFNVRRAYDGREGLRAMRGRRPDLLLLDLIMPGADGFQVLDEMRQDSEIADVPVILLTATSYAEDALQQYSNQMVIHRPDGLYPAEVLSCLRAVVGVLEPRYDERSVPEEEDVIRDA